MPDFDAEVRHRLAHLSLAPGREAEIVEELAQHLDDRWRALLQRPGFTAIAVLTLGLGIGGTTAIFTLVDGNILRPLPFPNAERFVAVMQPTRNSGSTTGRCRRRMSSRVAIATLAVPLGERARLRTHRPTRLTADGDGR